MHVCQRVTWIIKNGSLEEEIQPDYLGYWCYIPEYSSTASKSYWCPLHIKNQLRKNWW